MVPSKYSFNFFGNLGTSEEVGFNEATIFLSHVNKANLPLDILSIDFPKQTNLLVQIPLRRKEEDDSVWNQE